MRYRDKFMIVNTGKTTIYIPTSSHRNSLTVSEPNCAELYIPGTKPYTECVAQEQAVKTVSG